jgi:hypothetical protein
MRHEPSPSRRKHAGGCPAASDFLLFAQEKVTKEKGTPLRWPSASLSRQAQAGQCGNSLRLNFKGSEAQTSASLLTRLSLSSAAAQRGESKSKPSVACGATPSLRAQRSNPVQASEAPLQPLKLTSPLCRVGRRAELGAVEASVFEHVAARTIFPGGSCEFASRPIQSAGRGLPEGRHSGATPEGGGGAPRSGDLTPEADAALRYWRPAQTRGRSHPASGNPAPCSQGPFSFAPFFWASKRKGPAAGLPPANDPSNCDEARIGSRAFPSPLPPFPPSRAIGSATQARATA